MNTTKNPDALQLADIVEQSEGWTAYKAAAQDDWRDQFSEAVYEDLSAADNQDVPLEEYPARILNVLDAIVGPRHPTVIKWRNDAIRSCIAIAYKYCSDLESYRYLKQDLEAMLATPAHPAEVAQASVLNGTLAAHVMLPCVERIDVLEVAKELKENISAFGDTKGKAKERAAFYLVSQHEQLLYWQQQVRQLLAAAKVELKPLTDEAIRTLYGESDGHWQMVGPQVLCFARSIESAHGIQEQTT